MMSIIHSAKRNGFDPCAYLRDVLERLPTQPASQIEQLLAQPLGNGVIGSPLWTEGLRRACQYRS